MTDNKELITNFYKAFQNRDYKTMQQCYSDDAIFNDEVFSNLSANEVRDMWEMFCVKGKDLQIEFMNVRADEKQGSAEWKARYTFSKTNRKVVNHIIAKFILANGKIIRHTDHFNFYKWASQALGPTGFFLGWTQFVKNKVRKEGMKNLRNYMKQKMVTI